MRPSTSLNKIVIFQSIVLVTLFQNVLGDLRFLEQFLRNIIYHEEAHKYLPNPPKKPPLYPIIETTGQLAPSWQVDKYPDADFSKPAGFVIYGPKPPSEGVIYDQVEDWILDIFNIFNATFGKVMLALVILKKAAKLLILLVVLLFLPQLQQVIQKIQQLSYAKTGPNESDLFPFYIPTNTTYDLQNQLYVLQYLLQTSIEAFANKNLVCPGDDDIHCRLSMVFDQVDSYFPYYRINEIIAGTSTTATYTLELLKYTTTTAPTPTFEAP